MPDPAWYPTQAQLERKLRNAGALTMLGDPDGTGTVDADFLATCLASARGRVRSEVTVKHSPTVLDALDSETAININRMAVIFAAQVAWSDGSGGQAMPAGLVEDVAWAENEATKIREGKGFLGGASGVAQPALNQTADVLDYDKTGSGYSIAGFRRGFR